MEMHASTGSQNIPWKKHLLLIKMMLLQISRIFWDNCEKTEKTSKKSRYISDAQRTVNNIGYIWYLSLSNREHTSAGPWTCWDMRVIACYCCMYGTLKFHLNHLRSGARCEASLVLWWRRDMTGTTGVDLSPDSQDWTSGVSTAGQWRGRVRWPRYWSAWHSSPCWRGSTLRLSAPRLAQRLQVTAVFYCSVLQYLGVTCHSPVKGLYRYFS